MLSNQRQSRAGHAVTISGEENKFRSDGLRILKRYSELNSAVRSKGRQPPNFDINYVIFLDYYDPFLNSH